MFLIQCNWFRPSVVYSLFIVALIVCVCVLGGGGVGVFDTCIVVQYVVLFLVLQSSPWGSLFVCLFVSFFTSTQQSFSYVGRFFLGLTSTKLG